MSHSQGGCVGYASMEEKESKEKRRHGQDTDPRGVSAVFCACMDSYGERKMYGHRVKGI